MNKKQEGNKQQKQPQVDFLTNFFSQLSVCVFCGICSENPKSTINQTQQLQGKSLEQIHEQERKWRESDEQNYQQISQKKSKQNKKQNKKEKEKQQEKQSKSTYKNDSKNSQSSPGIKYGYQIKKTESRICESQSQQRYNFKKTQSKVCESQQQQQNDDQHTIKTESRITIIETTTTIINKKKPEKNEKTQQLNNKITIYNQNHNQKHSQNHNPNYNQNYNKINHENNPNKDHHNNLSTNPNNINRFVNQWNNNNNNNNTYKNIQNNPQILIHDNQMAKDQLHNQYQENDNQDQDQDQDQDEYQESQESSQSLELEDQTKQLSSDSQKETPQQNHQQNHIQGTYSHIIRTNDTQGEQIKGLKNTGLQYGKNSQFEQSLLMEKKSKQDKNQQKKNKKKKIWKTDKNISPQFHKLNQKKDSHQKRRYPKKKEQNAYNKTQLAMIQENKAQQNTGQKIINEPMIRQASINYVGNRMYEGSYARHSSQISNYNQNNQNNANQYQFQLQSSQQQNHMVMTAPHRPITNITKCSCKNERISCKDSTRCGCNKRGQQCNGCNCSCEYPKLYIKKSINGSQTNGKIKEKQDRYINKMLDTKQSKSSYDSQYSLTPSQRVMTLQRFKYPPESDKSDSNIFIQDNNSKRFN